MSIVWRIQHHQWRDFVYPDGTVTKVLIVPQRTRNYDFAHDRVDEIERRAHNRSIREKVINCLSVLEEATTSEIIKFVGDDGYDVSKCLTNNRLIFYRVREIKKRTYVWRLKEAA